MQKLVLVHLSDIHFNRSSGISAFDLDADLRNEVLRDAVALTKGLGGATGVLVTGDIAYSGKSEEYDRAASWLLQFCQDTGCRGESVWVVPGNHDVDRTIANQKFTKLLHECIRAKSGTEIDIELRDTLSDPQSGSALLAPLDEYNRFAGRFQCSISPEKPYWERDLRLDCGTTFRLRGISSALVSNAQDAKNNLVLGTAQVNVPRTDGVEYLTLCHHPPDWLQDQDSVLSQLESKVRIQLFGHKHAQRVQKINDTLRVVAGATHPERGRDNWDPTYNVLEIGRLDNENIRVRLFQRQWNRTDCRFVAAPEPEMGNHFREYVLKSCLSPEHAGEGAASAQLRTRSELPAPDHVPSITIPEDTDTMPPQNNERRLTFRFLTLPFRCQIEVVQSLDLLMDTDRALGDEALFQVVFKRAAEKGVLPRLWDETEKRHPDPATSNPFEIPK